MSQNVSQVLLAQIIATVAHGARGQKRADDVTPYITHPKRVAELTTLWNGHGDMVPIAAAWLHDVLEDTRLTRDDLIGLGVSWDVLNIVDRLTKPKPVNAPATPAYYQGISESEDALLVKCADRCANLEDALSEVEATRGLRRWKRYVEKTYADVLPMYSTLPELRAQLEHRLQKIEITLNASEKVAVG